MTSWGPRQNMFGTSIATQDKPWDGRPGDAVPTTGRSASYFFDDPDVAEHDGIAVVLQEQRCGIGRSLCPDAQEWCAAIPDRRESRHRYVGTVTRAFAVLFPSASNLAAVKSMSYVCQLSGGKHMFNFGLTDRIDPAAFVVATFQTERIEHLYFVTTLHVHATVAASLAARLGHERRAKLDVQLVITERLFGISPGCSQVMIVGQTAVVPVIDVRTVKQHDRAGRRFCPQRRALCARLSSVGPALRRRRFRPSVFVRRLAPQIQRASNTAMSPSNLPSIALVSLPGCQPLPGRPP